MDKCQEGSGGDEGDAGAGKRHGRNTRWGCGLTFARPLHSHNGWIANSLCAGGC
ncbi:hypothetical protein Y88_2174 [Novosphingobium nitrogenifigens DSM 19370]|uniref:Uncharacterized protein n=1 Tax=Novosphingobium nitrogenifigens DSM 19370 TaxID=983920 RepID=F1Z5C2_9SPHN|nr:hypothetical protein Y88_2174 [Novosphingobium nitrogenifigens DSM 19370]